MEEKRNDLNNYDEIQLSKAFDNDLNINSSKRKRSEESQINSAVLNKESNSLTNNKNK